MHPANGANMLSASKAIQIFTILQGDLRRMKSPLKVFPTFYKLVPAKTYHHGRMTSRMLTGSTGVSWGRQEIYDRSEIFILIGPTGKGNRLCEPRLAAFFCTRMTTT